MPGDIQDDHTDTRRVRWRSFAAVGLLAIAALVAFSWWGGPPSEIANLGGGLGQTAGSFASAPVGTLDGRWRRVPFPDAPVDTWMLDVVSSGDAIIVPSDLGLVALDAASGRINWRTAIDGPAPGHGLVIDGDVIVGSSSDGLVAVGREDGAGLWSLDLAGIRNRLAAADGLVAVTIAADTEGWPPDRERVVGVSSIDGQVLWEFAVPPEHSTGWGGGADVVGGAVLVLLNRYTADEQDRANVEVEPDALVIVLDPATGEERWRVDGVHGSSVAVGDGRAMVVERIHGGGRWSYELVAYDLAEGAESWRVPVRDHVSSLTLGEPWAGPLSTGQGEVLLARGARLLIYDAADGRLRARHDLPRQAVDSVHAMSVHGDTVYLTTHSSSLHAIALGDGEQVWQVREPYLGSDLTVTGDGVVVVHLDGRGLVAYDGVSGHERWEHRSYGTCQLGVADGDVVVSGGAWVGAFGPRDGRRLWSSFEGGGAREIRSGDQVASTLLRLSDGRPAVVTAYRGWSRYPARTTLVARDARTGGEIWRSEVDEATEPTIASDGERLFLVRTEWRPDADDGDPRATVIGADRDDGARIWGRSFDTWLAVPLAAGGGRLVAVLGDGSVAALTAADGSVEWRRSLDDGAPPSRAVVSGGQVLLIGREEVVSWSLRDAAERWRTDLGGVTSDEVAVVDDLLVLGAGTDLVALTTADGAVAWRVPLDAPVGGGVSAAGDRLHVATAAGLELRDLRDGSVIAEEDTDRAPVGRPVLAGGRLHSCFADGSVRVFGP